MRQVWKCWRNYCRKLPLKDCDYFSFSEIIQFPNFLDSLARASSLLHIVSGFWSLKSIQLINFWHIIHSSSTSLPFERSLKYPNVFGHFWEIDC